MNINNRISVFFEYKKIIQAELVKRGYGSKQTISFIFNGRQSPNYKFLKSVIKDYPELNPRWLFVGEGEMITDNCDQKSQSFTNKEYANSSECAEKERFIKVQQQTIECQQQTIESQQKLIAALEGNEQNESVSG